MSLLHPVTGEDSCLHPLERYMTNVSYDAEPLPRPVILRRHGIDGYMVRDHCLLPLGHEGPHHNKPTPPRIEPVPQANPLPRDLRQLAGLLEQIADVLLEMADE